MFRRLSLMILPGLLMLSTCAPSVGEASSPGQPTLATKEGVSVPGMPDRPDSAQETVQPYFREDTLEAIGATGRPQLVVFWGFTHETHCYECEMLRTPVQELEAEFWDQVDFVYLNQEREDVQAVKASLGIPDCQYRMFLVLLSSGGEMVRRFYNVTRDERVAILLNDDVIRQGLNKYLSEQEG